MKITDLMPQTSKRRSRRCERAFARHEQLRQARIEQAETFSKDVDIADKALRFATLPAGIKRAPATRVMAHGGEKQRRWLQIVHTSGQSLPSLKAVAKAKEVAP